MIVVGMNYSINSNGVKTTTLHVMDEFGGYYTNAETGRGCIGKKSKLFMWVTIIVVL